MPSDRTYRGLPWTPCSFTRPATGWFISIWYIRTRFPIRVFATGVIHRLLSGVGRAMAIARLTHLRISIPSSGAPAGRVPMECFPLATAPVSQARRRRVSIANEVTTLNEEEINTLNADESPEVPPVSPPLTLPVEMEEAAVVSTTGPTPLIMTVVERSRSKYRQLCRSPECYLLQDSLHSYFLRMMEGWTRFGHMCAVWWTCIVDICADWSGVTGHSGRNGRAGGRCFAAAFTRQFVGGDTDGGLRSHAPAAIR